MGKVTIVLVLFVSMAFAAKNGAGKSFNVVINDSLTAKANLLYSDDFEKDLSFWHPEIEDVEMQLNDGKMELDVPGGCTVWFNKAFSSPCMIEYDVEVIDNGGENDRVSDLNCFWLATDPESPDNLFKYSERRGGKFPNYSSLALYYAGIGGHNNTKTRFRRYSGNGDRPLLDENDLSDEKYMITPNVKSHIRIIAYDNIIQYYRDGVLIFDFNDDTPYKEGYFGIRTVDNHMTVDNFKVYKLK